MVLERREVIQGIDGPPANVNPMVTALLNNGWLITKRADPDGISFTDYESPNGSRVGFTVRERNENNSCLVRIGRRYAHRLTHASVVLVFIDDQPYISISGDRYNPAKQETGSHVEVSITIEGNLISTPPQI